MNSAIVTNLRKISSKWYLLILKPGENFDAHPGQFIYMKVSKTTDPLLRRPFSIHYFDKKDNILMVLFQVAGKGTTIMKDFSRGDRVDFMGPLGKGFEVLPHTEKAVLVAGGIGMAPLFFLADFLKKEQVPFDFLVGADTLATLPPLEYFHQLGIEPFIATDDGSFGFKGMVTELFHNLYHNNEGEGLFNVYSCGPEPMLTTVVKEANLLGVPVQVSLEARMACGVGACLGCVCGIREKESGNFSYGRVCKEGPVFPGEAVVFHEG